jgi:PIN domain nuclease of toxin-antitoxin system
MNYLLDTHTFLWFINADPSLSAPAQAAIEPGTNDIFLSIASLWEMAIKVSLGKLIVTFTICRTHARANARERHHITSNTDGIY